MRYRISEIKLDIRQSQEELPTAVRKKIKKKDLDIHDLKIIKESVDARKKPDIKKVYTLEFSCSQKASAERSGGEKISGAVVADGSGKDRPVVVGFGPAGMFAGLILAEMGLKPVILERGEPVEQRIKTVQKFWKDGIPRSGIECSVWRGRCRNVFRRKADDWNQGYPHRQGTGRICGGWCRSQHFI